MAQEAVDEISDDLVARLIEYRRIRDASSILYAGATLADAVLATVQRPPPAPARPKRSTARTTRGLGLVSAFGRILRERQPRTTATVVVDDTPIHVYMERIHSLVCQQKRIELTTLFEAGMHKKAHW